MVKKAFGLTKELTKEETKEQEEGELGIYYAEQGKSAATSVGFYKICWIDQNALNPENTMFKDWLSRKGFAKIH